MQQFIVALFSVFLILASLMLGAVFFLILIGVISGFALYVFIRAKLTGKPPANMRFYRYEQRTTAEPDTTRPASPQIQVIDAEFEEIADRK